MRITNNIPALNTARKLRENSGRVSKDIVKLSSGLRVSSAAADVAGLAISEKMRAQIRGLSQASINAQDGVSLIQAAEGALQEIHDLLQRQRELAVQIASDTYTNADRAAADLEFQQMIEEIDSIANSTSFNNKNLLDGSLSKSTDASPAPMSAPVAAPYAAPEIAPFAAGLAAPGGTAAYTTADINNITITGNGVFTIAAGFTGKITVQAGLDVVIQQQTAAQLQNVTIGCGAGTNLFINNLNIQNTDNISAITFTGVGNTLNLMGTNTLAKGAGGGTDVFTNALILVQESTELTINNAAGQNGTLNATINNAIDGTNNVNGAVIGGSRDRGSGTINIMGGTVNVTANANGREVRGAAIGGGLSGNNSGNITISGATVNVVLSGGDIRAAAIGGGMTGSGGNITISNATVNAALSGGDIRAAAIGGGDTGNGANLLIDGGSVTVTNGWIGGGSGSETTGKTMFGNWNDINTLFGKTKNTIADGAGTPIYRIQITGASFPPNTEIGYNVGGLVGGLKTDGGGNFYIYEYADSDGATISMRVNGIDYTGTLTVDTNHNNIVALSSAPDTNPPVLSSGSANRTADGTATFKFTSNKAGDYYYLVLDSDDWYVPTDPVNVKNDLNSIKGSCGVSRQTINLTDLTAGAKNVFIVVEDENGYSNILKVSIPAYDPSKPSDPAGGGITLQTGANSGDTMTVYIEEMSASGLGLTGPPTASVVTQQSAQTAIGMVDGAIGIVSTQRSSLGAYQNQLEYTIANLDNRAENLTNAESRIRDADTAKEMTDLTKNQILQQSATAMLALANVMPHSVLALLQ